MSEIDTGTDHLLARVDDGVGVITMNRPERRNALTPEMLDALARTLAAFEVDDAVRVVVLTGAGGAFCAGGDVKAMADGSRAPVPYDVKVHQQRLSHRATSG
jgi:2-(1,2-epoxy-1,2-dihydrophenyl)acetyl-CoA isomerase